MFLAFDKGTMINITKFSNKNKQKPLKFQQNKLFEHSLGLTVRVTISR